MECSDFMRARLLAALASGGLLASIGCRGQNPSSERPLPAPAPAVDASPRPREVRPGADAPAVDMVAVAIDAPVADAQAEAEAIDATRTPAAAEGPSPRPRCSQHLARHCFTRSEMVAATADHGLRPPGVPEPPRPRPTSAANGCFESRFLSDGCCNRASGAPWREGSRCCYWFCEGGCCGRPFEVDGRARAAPLSASRDWLASLDGLDGLDVSRVDAETRRALADAWRADAAMEHASVASFARFTLQLLAVGAPPSLVEEAQRASLDEVAHARACFAAAARFDGAALGPGPLDLSGARLDEGLAGAVRAAVREGCVGETVSACVVRAQAEGATDPALRRVLTVIADDEARHAELAWRFVAWALAKEPSLRGAIEVTFEATRRERFATSGAPPGVDEAAWRAFGRLGADTAREAARRAAAEVVAPCAAALLGERPRAARATSVEV